MSTPWKGRIAIGLTVACGAASFASTTASPQQSPAHSPVTGAIGAGAPLVKLSIWVEVVESSGTKKRVLVARAGERVTLTIPSGARIPVILSAEGSVPPFQGRWEYSWYGGDDCQVAGDDARCYLAHSQSGVQAFAVGVNATPASATAGSTPPLLQGTRIFSEAYVTLAPDGKTRARCPGRVGKECWGQPTNVNIELVEATVPSKLRLRIRGVETPGSQAHDKCCDENPNGHSCRFFLSAPEEKACKKEWDQAGAEVVGETIGVVDRYHAKTWEYDVTIERSASAVALPSERRVPAQATTTTVFVVDVSGSMGHRFGNQTRLEAAQAAVEQVLELLAIETIEGARSHQAGLLAFASGVEHQSPLSAEWEKLRDQLKRLRPSGQTNMGAGLAAAFESLKGMSGERLVILLSDGEVTAGLRGPQLLEGPVREAAKAGLKIYTVGVGDPSDLDEPLLRAIAAAAGGAYYRVADAGQLAQAYRRAWHSALGEILLERIASIAQGETSQPQTIEVPFGVPELHTTLSWPGSELDLVLVDPMQRRVDAQYQQASLQHRGSQKYLLVRNPAPGVWHASVFGKQVPKGSTTYQLLVSRRRPPESAVGVGGGAPLPRGRVGETALLVLEVLSITLLLAIVVVLYQRRSLRLVASRRKRKDL